MLNSDELETIWDEAMMEYENIKKPEIFYARHNNNLYYVLEDSRSVFFIMSSDDKGDRYKVYAVVAEKCHPNEDGTEYEVENRALKIVSCSKPFNIEHEIMLDALSH